MYSDCTHAVRSILRQNSTNVETGNSNVCSPSAGIYNSLCCAEQIPAARAKNTATLHSNNIIVRRSLLSDCLLYAFFARGFVGTKQRVTPFSCLLQVLQQPYVWYYLGGHMRLGLAGRRDKGGKRKAELPNAHVHWHTYQRSTTTESAFE